MRHGRILIIILGICSLTLARPVWAQDPIHKAGRGLANLLTGWIELPKELDMGRRQENPLTGIAGGLFKGVTLGLLRTGVGVYEILTFPVPYPKDFVSPYEGMALPDYAWD